MFLSRGQPIKTHNEKTNEAEQTSSNKKKAYNTNQSQQEDFDFWSMPQNQHGKKKKDFVENSNLWVNQK